MSKIAFYYKEINRAGSELALLRYFQNCKNNSDKVLIYENDDTSDKSVLDEFSKCVEVYHLLKGEQYEAKCAVNCSIYDVFEEIFDNIKAERYIFWAQVNPFYNGRYEDRTRLLRYDSFLVPSKYIQNILLENLPEIKDRIFVANPIVDIENIRKMSMEEQDVIKKGEKKNILTVARFSESKGIDIVLKVAKELNNMNLDLNWYILGLVADSKKDFYEETMQEGEKYGLKYLGVSPNPYKYMKDADLTAIFSKDEAWGLVVTESKAVGVPVVISKIGGMTEQVQDEIDGLVYNLPQNDEDIKNIAKGMYELLTNDKKYKEMRSNLKNFEYNIDEIINTMNQCFYNN